MTLETDTWKGPSLAQMLLEAVEWRQWPRRMDEADATILKGKAKPMWEFQGGKSNKWTSASSEPTSILPSLCSC